MVFVNDLALVIIKLLLTLFGSHFGIVNTITAYFIYLFSGHSVNMLSTQSYLINLSPCHASDNPQGVLLSVLSVNINDNRKSLPCLNALKPELGGASDQKG